MAIPVKKGKNFTAGEHPSGNSQKNGFSGRSSLKHSSIVAHTDGSARPNPGRGSYGVIFSDRTGRTVRTLCGSLGVCTNNFAEYVAFLIALWAARGAGFSALEVFSDSELLARHFSGEYEASNPDLSDLLCAARSIASEFERFTLTHIPRERNREADKLARSISIAA